MNRKQFVFLIAGLFIVGAACLCLAHRNNESMAPHEAKVGDRVFPGFQVSAVASIHVKAGSEFNVMRTNGGWCVRERSGYPANVAQITDLLMRLKEARVIQSDVVGPSQLAALDLNPPGPGRGHGASFEFRNEQGRVLFSLLVGKKHLRPESASDPFRMNGLFDSCYVLLPADPANVLLVSDDLAPAAPEPGAWLSREFFKIEHVKVVSLAAPNPSDSWEISRESDSAPWVLSDTKPGETLNRRVASDAADILAFPTFVDVIPERTSGPSNSANPLGSAPAIVTVLADQGAYVLKIGPPRADGTRCVKISVTPSTPPQPLAAPNESPEDRERRDKAFDESARALRAKGAREQALARWIYVADTWIDLLNRKRAQLLEPQTVAAEQSAGR